MKIQWGGGHPLSSKLARGLRSLDPLLFCDTSHSSCHPCRGVFVQKSPLPTTVCRCHCSSNGNSECCSFLAGGYVVPLWGEVLTFNRLQQQ